MHSERILGACYTFADCKAWFKKETEAQAQGAFARSGLVAFLESRESVSALVVWCWTFLQERANYLIAARLNA